MSLSIENRNTTYSSCPICTVDYDKDQVRNTKEVVELVCGHFFHFNCLKPWIKSQESSNSALKCGYCNQIYAHPSKENPQVLTNQTDFENALKKIRTDYPYDIVVVKATFRVAKIFDEVSAIYQDVGLNQQFLERIRELITNRSDIEDELKGTTLMVIGAIISNDGCLRTLEGESRRWSGLPLANSPYAKLS